MQAEQKEQDRLVKEFLRYHNIYKTKEPLRFDLRGYAAYAKERGLAAERVTPEILEMFSK